MRIFIHEVKGYAHKGKGKKGNAIHAALEQLRGKMIEHDDAINWLMHQLQDLAEACNIKHGGADYKVFTGLNKFLIGPIASRQDTPVAGVFYVKIGDSIDTENMNLAATITDPAKSKKGGEI